MITSLSVKNYALIENLQVKFSNGMTCITGETGAGKSILLGAMNLILGKRADLKLLKDSKKKCIVEAIFNIKSYDLQNFFLKNSLDYENDTIVRREISSIGKTRAFINDTPVNLDTLNLFTQHLIDIHSQNENEIMLSSEYQLLVLDFFAKNEELLRDYTIKFLEHKTLISKLEEIERSKEKISENIDYKSFLYNELEKTDLASDIQEKIEERVNVLSNTEDFRLFILEGIQIIEDEKIGLLSQIGSLNSLFKKFSNKTSKLNNLSSRILSVSYDLMDILTELKSSFDDLESNPEELKDLETKLDLIYSLYKKHKVESVKDLILIKENLYKEINNFENFEDNINELRSLIEINETELKRLSTRIHENRMNAMPGMLKELQVLVAKMGMKNSRFKINLIKKDNFLKNGTDTIEFMFSANRGSDFKLLKKVVSGGELSRIILSMKSILARYKKLPTIIFDEIDSGVSGIISNGLADVMYEMSKKMQVFTITHSPQIASKGNIHIGIYKQDEDNSTVTKLRILNNSERIKEIAFMLSGKKITKSALEHAKQLLN
ncbi:MAG: DNA repair protein RecN [Flavobacteriaceae bacterium]|nr:DNA repair protein RecN [Flavobacteriaceae bacterium]